jgi:hypothetical protein
VRSVVRDVVRCVVRSSAPRVLLLAVALLTCDLARRSLLDGATGLARNIGLRRRRLLHWAATLGTNICRWRGRAAHPAQRGHELVERLNDAAQGVDDRRHVTRRLRRHARDCDHVRARRRV